MADTILYMGDGMPIKAVDNGDGTYSLSTSASASALPSGAATSAKQDAEAVLIGAVTETAPATDTASSGLNGRLQRIAQRLTSLIALLPAALGQGTMAQSLRVVLASDQSAVPISNTAFAAITPTHSKVDVGATTEQVLATNASRKYALFVNDSDTIIYLKIGAAAVLSEGIRLNANGGSFEMSLAAGNLATGAVNGINAGSGDKVLLVLEGV